MANVDDNLITHYIDNEKFSKAVVEYNMKCNQCEADGITIPKIPDYIGKCFMQIAEGRSKETNFRRYSYKEDMILDAIENCVRYIRKFDPSTPTQRGVPNAFWYFSTITYYAFVRRIVKEKKQSEIVEKLISNIDSSLSIYVSQEDEEILTKEGIMNRVSNTHQQNAKMKKYVKAEDETY